MKILALGLLLLVGIPTSDAWFGGGSGQDDDVPWSGSQDDDFQQGSPFQAGSAGSLGGGYGEAFGSRAPSWWNLQPPTNQDPGMCGCGSCWAHAGTALLEARLGGGVKLSIDQLEACACNYCANYHGFCAGNDPRCVFDYAMKRGLQSKDQFPGTQPKWWTSRASCEIDSAPKCTEIGGPYQVTPATNGEASITGTVNNEGLAALLSTGVDTPECPSGRIPAGPVVVWMHRLDWEQLAWQGGQGRMMADPSKRVFTMKHKASSSDSTHALLLVGQGSDATMHNGADYWVVRNSYGTEWGDHGYGYIAKEGGTAFTNFWTVCDVKTSDSFDRSPKNTCPRESPHNGVMEDSDPQRYRIPPHVGIGGYAGSVHRNPGQITFDSADGSAKQHQHTTIAAGTAGGLALLAMIAVVAVIHKRKMHQAQVSSPSTVSVRQTAML